MGLLSTLLTLPVSGPIKGTRLIAEQVLDAAEREHFDERRIRRELQELAGLLDAGELTEDEHAEAEAELLERLAEGRRRAAEASGTAETPWSQP